MNDKIRIKNIKWTTPEPADGGSSKFEWSFEIESVDGPLIHTKREGNDYYNGIPFWQIKTEAERLARQQAT